VLYVENMSEKIINEEQWKKLKQETHNTILGILESVDVLVKHIESPAYGKDVTPIMCAGLFTHSVEEYGKLLYLKNLKSENGKVTIDYDGKFKNHDYKFGLALEKLPKNCKIIKEGPFDSKIFDSKIFNTGTIADWDTRLQIFNTDLDGSGKVKEYPSVDKDVLKKVTFNFRNEMYLVKMD